MLRINKFTLTMPYEKIIYDRPYEANKCIWNQSQISKMELFVEIAND